MQNTPRVSRWQRYVDTSVPTWCNINWRDVQRKTFRINYFCVFRFYFIYGFLNNFSKKCYRLRTVNDLHWGFKTVLSYIANLTISHLSSKHIFNSDWCRQITISFEFLCSKNLINILKLWSLSLQNIFCFYMWSLNNNVSVFYLI